MDQGVGGTHFYFMQTELQIRTEITRLKNIRATSSDLANVAIEAQVRALEAVLKPLDVVDDRAEQGEEEFRKLRRMADRVFILPRCGKTTLVEFSGILTRCGLVQGHEGPCEVGDPQ